MKRVNIKCIVCNSLCNYRYYIKILDMYNNIVYEDSDFNGNLFINVYKNNVYRIVIIPKIHIYPYAINRKIIITENDIYTFRFSFYKRNDNNITFRLTDIFYSGLPIKKGEIILG